MSVLIKNMDKPTDCYQCRFWEMDYCLAMGVYDGNYPDYHSFDEFYKSCPLDDLKHEQISKIDTGKLGFFYEFLKCYECGAEERYDTTGDYRYKYCPHCGNRLTQPVWVFVSEKDIDSNLSKLLKIYIDRFEPIPDESLSKQQLSFNGGINEI